MDIRFYSSIERKVNEGQEISKEDVQFVQRCLESWSKDFITTFSHVLPEQFYYLLGSVHSALQPAVRQAFNIPSDAQVQPWTKYLFSSENLPPEPPSPLKDSQIDTIYLHHFDLVLASSPIPRTKEYLRSRIPVSTALYHDESRSRDPVAFCVTAPDKSLSILWVDPSCRSQGVGRYVAYHRLSGNMGVVNALSSETVEGLETEIGKGEMDGWSHADIAEDNAASRRICDWLGGIKGWTVVWIRVHIIAS